ncbi:MAG: hypothetical protein Q9227_007869 [Pyrenula ochraceoflavens]
MVLSATASPVDSYPGPFFKQGILNNSTNVASPSPSGFLTGLLVPTTATSSRPPTATGSSGPSTSNGQYRTYSGDGSLKDGWPSATQWTTFDTMWAKALNIMRTSCSNLNETIKDNSQDEIRYIKDAIQSQSHATKVDPRFILATVLQESGGCVRVKTTKYAINNPGLMQDHNGSHSCNDGKHVLDPCPKDQIVGMITDGTSGTKDGPGLQQLLGQASDNGGQGQKTYAAARLYNSGAIDKSKKLEAGIATHCYSTDIANRLMGWDGRKSGCTLDNKSHRRS